MAGRLSPDDPSSYSRPDQCKVEHIHLKLQIDFSQQILHGTATLKLERKADGVDSLVLDTRDLDIQKVLDNSNGQELKFTLGTDGPAFAGQKLEVALPSSNEKSLEIIIHYATRPQCTALQWLKPELTAGKKHPYLFSQCQAIHARSMVPCQDTPAVKMPYTAEISAPAELTVLMSAVRQGEETQPGDPSLKVHRFQQKVPIPSYLIAIVAGALESRNIGPRSKVWSEKEMVDQAAYEFAETEQMIAAGEALLGPYVWGVYDLLVLPPSFPYGGMENPCLTFVTPTLLAGDRSLADVVAHEIAHSWTGNLVTNKNPEHFWLNEGHTVFVERKIASRLQSEKHRHFSALGGWKDLIDTINVLGADNPVTNLVPDLTGIDPDDAFSTVPYEKGFNLLMYLEQLLGGPEIFEGFLKAYIEKFKYQSITTEDWKNFLYSYFHDKVALLDQVNWQAWFHTPGMPPVKPEYDSSLAEVCHGLCHKWCKLGEEECKEFTCEELKALSSIQVREFLALLLLEEPLSKAKIASMQNLYDFNAVRNSEIRFRWLRLGVKAQCEEFIPRALEFVSEQGRMKFVRPLYRDLYNWETSRPQAIANYKKCRAEMHPLTSSILAKDLKMT